MSNLDKGRWVFPSANGGEIKGISDAGVETFKGSVIDSLVRESIQNSLDACIDDDLSSTVKVEFELFQVPVAEFPESNRFRGILEKCRKFHRDVKTTSFFEDALKGFEDSISILRISDFGTTGLVGAGSDEIDTSWSRLTKQSGSSSKGDKSGGSFGIGKFATFASSKFRTVFFSSVAEDGVASTFGVSRLVSFAENDDLHAYTSGVGYFCEDERCRAIIGEASSFGSFRRGAGDSGTDVYILGFSQTEGFEREMLVAVLRDYLLSIFSNKLSVAINGVEISKDTLPAHISKLNISEETESLIISQYHLLAFDQDGKVEIHLDPEKHKFAEKYDYPVGSAVLLLLKQEGLDKKVIVTRAAGMRLFTRSFRNMRFSFTGILMVLGEKINKDFREMEAPSHDKWDPERASNPKRAEALRRELFKWVRDSILDSFELEHEDEVSAFGMELYLPDIEPQKLGKDSSKGEGFENEVKIKTREVTPKYNPASSLSVSDSAGAGEDVGSKYSNQEAAGNGSTGAAGQGDLGGMSETPVQARVLSKNQKDGRYSMRLVVPKDSSSSAVEIFIVDEKGNAEPVPVVNPSVGESNREINSQGNLMKLGAVKENDILYISFGIVFDQLCALGVKYYETN